MQKIGRACTPRDPHKSASGLKESKRPKSLDEYIKEKGKKIGHFFKPKFLQMLINRVKATLKHQIHEPEVVINVGLIEANKIGILSIKRGRRLAIKITKKSSSIEVASVAVKKYADHDQLFCDSDEYVSCYPDQSIVQFIHGKNIEFAVGRYKEKNRKIILKNRFIFV